MKKNTSKVIITAVIAVGVGLLTWNKVASLNASSTPVLQTGTSAILLGESAPLYDFGPVSMQKGNVEHAFQLANTTDADLVITRAETSCMCTRTVLDLPDGTQLGPFGMPDHGFSPALDSHIRPGEKVVIRAIFDPAAHGPAGIGPIERAVMLGTSKGLITMRFKANVTP